MAMLLIKTEIFYNYGLFLCVYLKNIVPQLESMIYVAKHCLKYIGIHRSGKIGKKMMSIFFILKHEKNYFISLCRFFSFSFPSWNKLTPSTPMRWVSEVLHTWLISRRKRKSLDKSQQKKPKPVFIQCAWHNRWCCEGRSLPYIARLRQEFACFLRKPAIPKRREDVRVVFRSSRVNCVWTERVCPMVPNEISVNRCDILFWVQHRNIQIQHN